MHGNLEKVDLVCSGTSCTGGPCSTGWALCKILEGKDLRLFREMLDSSCHADTMLPSCIRKGSELMGPLPSSGVLQKENTFATLTPEEVRVNSASASEAIWNSCKGTTSDRVAQEVFFSRITKEKKDDGWLEGPFYGDLPMDAVLTRRFRD